MSAMDLPINRDCPIAKSLQIVGQKWSLLILREALLGTTRFSGFKQIGAPSDILTKRLNELTEAGIFERGTYRDEGQRERTEYIVTESGKQLLTVLGALNDWGVQNLKISSPPVYSDRTTGEPVTLRFVTEAGRVVSREQVTARHVD